MRLLKDAGDETNEVRHRKTREWELIKHTISPTLGLGQS